MNHLRSQSAIDLVLSMILVFIALGLGVQPASAQFSSAIEGRVTDSTGAVVPSASVTLANMNTDVRQMTKTNESGFYRFQSLAPGMYKVTASGSGFQTVTQENIQLIAGAVQGVTLTLGVASTAASVEVTDAPPLVQTDESSVTGFVDRKEVEELPMQGRNFINAMTQAPGVVGTGAMGSPGQDIFIPNQGPAMSANGMPMSSNTNYLDGVFLSDSNNGGFVKLIPNPDSIQEMKITTTDYSAQFGMGGGAIVQLNITKTTGSQLERNSKTLRILQQAGFCRCFAEMNWEVPSAVQSGRARLSSSPPMTSFSRLNPTPISRQSRHPS